MKALDEVITTNNDSSQRFNTCIVTWGSTSQYGRACILYHWFQYSILHMQKGVWRIYPHCYDCCHGLTLMYAKLTYTLVVKLWVILSAVGHLGWL